MVPSLISQPGRTPSFLKLCQPLRSWPSNNSCHPAAFSSVLKEFSEAARQGTAQNASVREIAVREVKKVCFMPACCSGATSQSSRKTVRIRPVVDSRLAMQQSMLMKKAGFHLLVADDDSAIRYD